MKNKKKIIILTIILILSIGIMIATKGIIIPMLNSQKKQQEVAKGIECIVYDNTNGNLKLLVRYNDTENGIKEIRYNKDGEEVVINCNGKTKASIDYEIKQNGDYTFKFVNTKGETTQKILNVNEEYRKNIIKITNTQQEKTLDTQIQQQEEGRQDDIYYKIGDTGQWNKYVGTISTSYNQLKEVKDSQNNVKIYAKIEDGAKNKIETQTIIAIQKDWNIVANIPKLLEGMTAVYWDDKGNEIKQTDSRFKEIDWYDYDNQKWANAITKDGSYFVWIPRYEYKIENPYTQYESEIKINFIETKATIPTTGYKVHPAFGTDIDNGGWDTDLSRNMGSKICSRISKMYNKHKRNCYKWK